MFSFIPWSATSFEEGGFLAWLIHAVKPETFENIVLLMYFDLVRTCSQTWGIS